jgi:hypothetical protein
MLSVYLHRDLPVLLFCGVAAGTSMGISGWNHFDFAQIEPPVIWIVNLSDRYV